MRLVFGPKPGTVVKFALDVSPRKSIPDGRGGTIALPVLTDEERGVEGDEIIVSAKVPSEADKRALNHHFDGAKVIAGANGEVVVLSTAEKQRAWVADTIKTLVVKVEGLFNVDPVTGERTAWESPEDVLAFADDDVLNGIVNILTDRVRLSDVLRKKSKPQSGSSSPATPPAAGTAANAGAQDSAEPGSATSPAPLPTDTPT